MKTTSILLIVIGMLAIIIGATCKILHWPNATLIMSFGMFAQWSGIVLLVYYFIKKRKQQKL